MPGFIYNPFVQVEMISRVTGWWRRAGKAVRSLCLLMVTLGLCAWQEGGLDESTPPPVAVAGARQADLIAVITIDGPIDGVTSYSVQRRIKEAAEGGAQAIVFEINSPGGELGAVLEVSQAIKQSPVPNTVAWVHPKAYSGGAIIALACREIIVSPTAQMGDAFPVTPVAKDDGTTGLRGLTPDERTKLLPPLLADVVDSARRSGYDEYLVQAIVTDGIELWLVEEEGTGRRVAVNEAEYRAVFGREPSRGSPMFAHVSGGRAQAGVPGGADAESSDADGSAASTPEEQHFKPAAPGLVDLSRAVTDRLTVDSERPVFDAAQAGQWREVGYLTDGSAPIVMSAEQMRSVGFATAEVGTDEELRQFFGAKTLARVDQSWSETASGFLSMMPVRFVLIAVFLIALFIEMSSPGLILPGAIALLSGFLLLAPPMIIGMANWWEIGAIGLGVVLIALEIFVIPGFGIFGVIGLVALFGGLLGTFIPNQGLLPNASQTGDALRGVVTILLALMTAGVGMYFISKHFQTLPLLNRLVLTDRREEGEDLSLKEMLGPGPVFAVEVGATGVATTNLKPVGQAEFADRIVDVMSDFAFVRAGTPVRVVSVSATRVVVEPIEGASA